MDTTETIQLEQFVESALIQIIKAVSKVNPQIKELGGYLNPKLRDGLHDTDIRTIHNRHLTIVEFDVAVTATTSGESQYGIGVITAFLGAGAKEKKQAVDSTVSRIRFDIPILLPFSD